jgi:hypothetical protein
LEVFHDIYQLVVADGAGRDTIKAVEDDDVALSSDVGDELEGQVLTDTPVVGGGIVERVDRADVDRENRNVGVARLLQPGIDNAERTEELNDSIRFLGDEGLELRDELAVIAAGIDGDRLAAEALHLRDLGVVGLEVEEVVGSRRADADALAL